MGICCGFFLKFKYRNWIKNANVLTWIRWDKWQFPPSPDKRCLFQGCWPGWVACIVQILIWHRSVLLNIYHYSCSTLARNIHHLHLWPPGGLKTFLLEILQEGFYFDGFYIVKSEERIFGENKDQSFRNVWGKSRQQTIKPIFSPEWGKEK